MTLGALVSTCPEKGVWKDPESGGGGGRGRAFINDHLGRGGAGSWQLASIMHKEKSSVRVIGLAGTVCAAVLTKHDWWDSTNLTEIRIDARFSRYTYGQCNHFSPIWTAQPLLSRGFSNISYWWRLGITTRFRENMVQKVSYIYRGTILLYFIFQWLHIWDTYLESEQTRYFLSFLVASLSRHLGGSPLKEKAPTREL